MRHRFGLPALPASLWGACTLNSTHVSLLAACVCMPCVRGSPQAAHAHGGLPVIALQRLCRDALCTLEPPQMDCLGWFMQNLPAPFHLRRQLLSCALAAVLMFLMAS